MPMNRSRAIHVRAGVMAAALAAAAALPVAPAAAKLAISQLIVELAAGASTADVEVVNDSPERAYVTIDPRQVVDPGTHGQQAFVSPDPEKLGLLVSPRKMILEPGQRKRLRIAAVGAPSSVERVYRVTVKPVVGEVSGGDTGLKMLVGYDLLVLVRPADPAPRISASRSGETLTLVNRGNSSAELVDGRQCNAAGQDCVELPVKRLYAGASWTQTLPRQTKVQYRVHSAKGWSNVEF